MTTRDTNLETSKAASGGWAFSFWYYFYPRSHGDSGK